MACRPRAPATAQPSDAPPDALPRPAQRPAECPTDERPLCCPSLDGALKVLKTQLPQSDSRRPCSCSLRWLSLNGALNAWKTLKTQLPQDLPCRSCFHPRGTSGNPLLPALPHGSRGPGCAPPRAGPTAAPGAAALPGSAVARPCRAPSASRRERAARRPPSGWMLTGGRWCQVPLTATTRRCCSLRGRPLPGVVPRRASADVSAVVDVIIHALRLRQGQAHVGPVVVEHVTPALVEVGVGGRGGRDAARRAHCWQRLPIRRLGLTV